MKVAINICEEFAEQWETQARGGDNTGASDHRADAARQIIAELRNVNAAPQQPTQSGDALTRDLLETLQMMVQHFTKTPSTLADSKARGKAHEVIAKAYEQIGYTAPTAAPEKGDGRDAWISVDERLPDEGQNVAFVVSGASLPFDHLNGKVLGGYFAHVARHPTFSVPGLGLRASHWQPLPAPPAALSQKAGEQQ